jgi:tRNA A-37 threonylcarbamoyl transferase component Bud32
MIENDKRGSLEILYVPEDVAAQGGPAAGHLESMVSLAAGYQFREAGVVEHLRRVCAYVGALAAANGWSARETSLLRHSALFHDVGMTDVPESILRKEGKLTEAEIALVRRHPELGRALLCEVDAPLLREAAALAWTHHEAFDGSGYPRGIRGDEIPAGARILALADVFDALTTRRAFKDAYPVDVAVEIIRKGAGHRFDPEVVAAFLECRGEIERISVDLATPDEPRRPGFRISARDTAEGEFFAAARDAYFCCPFCTELHPRDTEVCPISRDPLREIHKLSGCILDGKYQIRVPRGVGGMGTVYEAQHLLIDRRLAIKFLDADLARSPQCMERFHNEARVFSTVGHPNLAEVTDMGRTAEGIPYMVMELLDGCSLAQLMLAGRLFTPTGAVSLVIEVLRTLVAVHAKGIVHRDLKPGNLFLVGDLCDPRLKILDFGVSLLLSADERRKRVTQDGDAFGTPEYMSPEQAKGRPDVDQRSDLFTVGEILYEMLTGRPVFDGSNPLVILSAVAACAIEPPGRYVDDLDPDLERAVLRALAREPQDRFQSAEEFLAPLLAFARRDVRFREGRMLDLALPNGQPLSNAPTAVIVPPD